jgi:hypothetical protein
MLERSFDSGKTLEQFMDLAQLVKARAANPLMKQFRLTFQISDNGHSNEELLESFDYITLRNWMKMEQMFIKRTIGAKDVKAAAKKLRQIELDQTRFGRQKT